MKTELIAFWAAWLISSWCSAQSILTPVEWKRYFTLKPEEGRAFTLDSTTVISRASVPGINIANDGHVILGYAGQGGRGQAITNNQGRTFTTLTNFACVINPAPRMIRSPACPQRCKSRIPCGAFIMSAIGIAPTAPARQFLAIGE